MSPITHGLISYTIGASLNHRRDRILVTAAGLIPDIDAISIIWGVEKFWEYHHTFTHSLIGAIFFSSLFLIISKDKLKTFSLIFLAVHVHLLCDLLGSGSSWEIPYLWPSKYLVLKFSPPFQWSLTSYQNFIITVVFMFFMVLLALFKGRTIVEIISVKLDHTVVGVIKRWVKTLFKWCL